MITWSGTRPQLTFLPTRRIGEKIIKPYNFYDVGFYTLGVSEPRYDWGVWAFSGSDVVLTHQLIDNFVARKNNEIDGQTDLAQADREALKTRLKAKAADLKKIIGNGRDNQPNMNLDLAKAIAGAELKKLTSGGIDLGSAYRLKKPGLGIKENAEKRMQILESVLGEHTENFPVDHTNERNFISGDPTHERKDVHFFKRARRMVMSEEAWGHRKPFIEDNELMGWGAFKAPSLRNVELTAPYMHNGRFLTLRQVLDFYAFDNPDLIPAHPINNPDLHPEMGRLLLNPDGKVGQAKAINLVQVQDSEALLFFLLCLTDERVKHERAPFDHPSLRVVNGFDNPNDPAVENWISIDAVGAQGHQMPAKFPSDK
jgi:hypothetical protein